MTTQPVWTYANLWDSIAATLPDEPAVIQNDQDQVASIMNWREFSARADAMAAGFVEAGLTHQSKVAVYATNCAEYLVACYAAFKAGMVPFNVNYRYQAEEVAYLMDNGDAEAVVFETTFNDIIAEVRPNAPGVKQWIAVERGGQPTPEGAVSFQQATAIAPDTQPYIPAWGRSGDDQFFIYTGGTTGMPKGVMWRQVDLIARGQFGANPIMGLGPLESPEHAGPRAKMLPIRSRSLIACPLMHGTGILSAFGALTGGGTVLLLPPGKFQPETLWDMVETHRATRMAIVGQPFAAPLLEALNANKGRWDLSSVMAIGSSGAMWSRENKLGLIEHIPQVTLSDSFSSSEALGMGVSMMTKDSEVQTARFELGETCAVFRENGTRVAPGSGERGKVAVGGIVPMGYYKDPEKSAATFPIMEGQRWSMPGDWAEVLDNGELILLGRGSQCINTGGEKVFPEEVEEALKRHTAVRDAAVTGLPDDRFGERIAALVELTPGASTPAEAELIEHVRDQLAHYKAPRHLAIVDSVARAPNGKLDYKAVKDRALAAFAEDKT